MADLKISQLTNYTPPLDADIIPIVDTANTTTKKVTWANIKATLKTYFDTLYQAVLGLTSNVAGVGFTITGGATPKTLTVPLNATVSGTNTGDQTNITGNAGTVTTNANLTGVITSVGNATSVASQTGTGNKFVMDTSPTLVTPNLGVASATSLKSNTLSATTNNSINLAAGSYGTIQTYSPAGAGTATLDLSLGNIHHITMPASGNITIALSNGTTGQCFIVRILQGAAGSQTVTWFTTIKWSGGVAPTLTTTTAKADTLGFEITGTNTYDGFVIGQNI